MKKPIVVFGEDCGAHPTSTQHIVKHLANERIIIWINSLGLRRPRFSKYDLRRIFNKLFRFLGKKPRQLNIDTPNNLYVINPLTLPFPNSKLAQWFNAVSLTFQIKKTLKKLSIERPILWISLPTAYPIIGKLNEEKVIYYCADDFSSLAGVDHKPIAKLEQKLITKAQIIFVASESLKNKFCQYNPILLEHGVDHEIFQKKYQRPDDFPTYKNKKIIGFIGAIENWVDLDLLSHAARQLSNYYFLFIGHIKTDISQLKNLNNVFMLGPKPYSDIPAYLKNWDVSIIPFNVQCKEVQHCDPLKLREYLAAGKPIVATDFLATRNYQNVISVAHSYQDFVDKISNALTNPGSSQKRIEAAGADWKTVSQYASDKIEVNL